MADKKFGVKQIDLIGASGTPNLTSPNNLNLNAVTVAISTDVTIGGQVTSNIIVGTGKSIGIGTTVPTGDLDVRGQTNLSNLNVSGVSTFAGITTVTGSTLFSKQLDVVGVSTFRTNVDIYNGALSLKTPTDENVFSLSYSAASDDVTFYFQQTGGTGGSRVIYQLLDNAEFYISNASTGGGIARFVANGANELYYDDVKKFETLGAGVTITGTTFTNQLSVSGVTTIGSAVTSATLLNVTGVSTFNQIKLGFTTITAIANNNLNSTIVVGDDLYIYQTRNPGSAPYNTIHSDEYSLYLGTKAESGGSSIYSILVGIHTGNDLFTNNTGWVSLGYGADPYKLETIGAGVTINGTTFTNQLSVSGVSTIGDVLYAANGVVLGTTANSNEALVLGGSSQTGQLYYNSASSRNEFSSTNTDFYIRAKDYTFATGPSGFAAEIGMTIADQGAVSLYYDNSKKFETLGAGATVTGTTFTNQLSVSGVSTIGPVATGTTSLYLGGPLKVGEIDISGGSNSVHVGQGAGRKNYNGGSGQQNTAVGYNALGVNGASNFNTAFGISALGALGDTQFNNYDANTAIGAYAGSSLLTGYQNTFVGRSAGSLITSGANNTILGRYDGNSGGLDIRTSSNNVVLSDGAGNIKLVGNLNGVGIGTTNPTSALEVGGTIKDSIGNVRSIPQNAQTSAYILAVTDVGKHVAITTGGITVPSSTFSAGDNLTIFNNSDNNQMITPSGGVTLRRAGVGDTGARGLNGYGLATILCIGSNSFVITGAGLT